MCICKARGFGDECLCTADSFLLKSTDQQSEGGPVRFGAKDHTQRNVLRLIRLVLVQAHKIGKSNSYTVTSQPQESLSGHSY